MVMQGYLKNVILSSHLGLGICDTPKHKVKTRISSASSVSFILCTLCTHAFHHNIALLILSFFQVSNKCLLVTLILQLSAFTGLPIWSLDPALLSLFFAQCVFDSCRSSCPNNFCKLEKVSP